MYIEYVYFMLTHGKSQTENYGVITNGLNTRVENVYNFLILNTLCTTLIQRF